MWKYLAYNYLQYFIPIFTTTLALIWGFERFYLRKTDTLKKNWYPIFFIHCAVSLVIAVPSSYFLGNSVMHDKRMKVVEELNLFRQEIYKHIDSTSEEIQERQSKATGETEWPVKTSHPLMWPATTSTYWHDKMSLLYPDIQKYFSPGTSTFFNNNIFNFINEPRRGAFKVLEHKIILYHSFTNNEAAYLIQSANALINRMNKETEILFMPLTNTAAIDVSVTPLKREIGVMDLEKGIIIHPSAEFRRKSPLSFKRIPSN